VLLYKQDGSLYCVTKKALQLAGFQSLADFLAEHRDYSELFVKKPGYIYNFENFSWINFLKHATPQQKKALLQNRDGAIFACDVEIETYLPLEAPSDQPTEYYEVTLKNVTLLDDNGEIAAQQPLFDAPTAPTAPFSQAASTDKEEPAQEAFEQEPEISLNLDLDSALSTPSQTKTEPEETSIFQESDQTPQKAESAAPSPIDITPIDLDTALSAPSDQPAETVDKEEEKEEIALSIVDITLNEEPTQTQEPKGPSQITFDTEKIAKRIGLSEEITASFLQEFLEDVKAKRENVETALKNADIIKAKKEILQIKGVAANLTLQDIEKRCDEMLHSHDAEEIKKLFISLVQTLFPQTGVEKEPEELTVSNESPEPEASSQNKPTQPTDTPVLDDDEIIPLMTDDAPASAEPTDFASSSEDEEGVLFDPKAAAEALGLPTDLILEFTNDFITQCHDEKENFQKAVEAGDLETINTTAHKLKGVAANLRIESLRDLLKQIQYTERVETANELIQKLYAKVAQLETQMKEMS